MAETLKPYQGRVMLIALAIVLVVVVSFSMFKKGVEFFVDTDPDFASVLISARGNLSADEKRNIVTDVERRVASVDGLKYIYASAGGQSNNLNRQGGTPGDNIGHLSGERKDYTQRRRGADILETIRQRTANIPGVHVEVRLPQNGPPSGKDVMIDVSSDDYAALANVTAAIRAHIAAQPEM